MKPLKRCESYQLGFHFDESLGKYKVIREFQFFDDQHSKFQLITVGENSWKALDLPNYTVDQGFDAAIFWNDAFHWKLSEADSEQENKCILSFDLIEEKFFTIPYPRYEDGSYCYPENYQLTDAGGSLKIVEHELSRYLNIWIVTGNKSEGFEMVLQYTYTFCIPPSIMMHYDLISALDDEIYLLQGTKWKLGNKYSSLHIFAPETENPNWNIYGVPPLFKLICIKPSLLSPFA